MIFLMRLHHNSLKTADALNPLSVNSFQSTVPGITGHHGQLAVSLVVREQKPGLEEYQLTRQMAELPVVETVLKLPSCLVEHVPQVSKKLNCMKKYMILRIIQELHIVRYICSLLLVNCAWENWSAWSTCSITCGTGIKIRTRRISVHESNGGTACSGDNMETSQQSCGECFCKRHFFII